MLGALLLRALARPWLAILVGGLYAASDEIHQHFVRGRHAAWYDVVIDTVGVTIGVVVWSRSRWDRTTGRASPSTRGSRPSQAVALPSPETA